MALAVHQALSAPPSAQLWEILEQADIRLLARYLVPRLTHPAQAFPLLAASWETLLKGGSGDLPRDLLKNAVFPPELEPVKPRLLAEWAMHYQATNADSIEYCDDELWGWWKKSAMAAFLNRNGEAPAAAHLYTDLWRAMPWHVNACLMAHALAHPGHADLSRSKDTSILLYSWNKAQLLEQTLDSLYDSSIGAAHVVVLDNGSSDNMPQVLEAASARFGADRFFHVRLPVNIGAPGARNWLLSLPRVRQSQYAAFLDDDVILPPDWLGRLFAAVPDGPFGAVGCRIVAARQPYGLQSADYNVYPPDFSKNGTRLGVHDNCSGQLDMGMFGYDRPCLSVSGCCHLLNMESIAKAGMFDIRYTPTQFDDLDRDLRSCLAGYPTYYAGSLRVRHVQHSSLAKAASPASQGNVTGNQMKLQARFEDAELTRLFHLDQSMLWDNLLHKADALESA